ncbi:MAG: hypothetical protein KGV56_05970 [Gammaproteobacteria bacterium]|nr:hypothetical protein [Gammaproteobacteria bacterium]
MADKKKVKTDLYLQAYNYVVANQKCFIGEIKKHLNISYDEAADIVEMLHHYGVVSEPINGVRKVLVKEDKND